MSDSGGDAGHGAVNELAERLFDAFEHGDAATVRELTAAGARFWNPYREVGTDRLLVTLDAGQPLIPGLRYVERVRHVFADGSGFVQQHRVLADGPDGPLDMPAGVVGLVADGRLTRLDMYYDTFLVVQTGLGGERESST